VDVRDLGLHGPQTIDGHSENKASYDGRLRFQGMSQMPIRRGLCSATVEESGGFDVTNGLVTPPVADVVSPLPRRSRRRQRPAC
jgi:hypothetical protein